MEETPGTCAFNIYSIYLLPIVIVVDLAIVIIFIISLLRNPLLAANIALHKPTWQSGTWRGGESDRAVDGDVNAVWSGKSCTATEKRENPWWVVDLGRPTQLYRVDVTNRADCCR